MKLSEKILVLTPIWCVLTFFAASAQTPCPGCDVTDKVKTAMLCMQRYSWEHGTAMQGVMEIGDTATLIVMARESVQRGKPDGRLSMVGSDMNIADTGVNGPAMLHAFALTGDSTFLKAADAQYKYLKLPASKDVNGVIYHNNLSEVIFSDNMFMVAPFLAQMGDYDEAMAQIESIRDLLWNPERKLFHHIRVGRTGEFKDISFWGGGNGWCAVAMAQVAGYMPPERKVDKQKLIGYYTGLLDGLLACQLPSGLFYDKITEPNFEESTLAAMVAYSIYTGLKAGWLDVSYKAAADKMREAVLARVDDYGVLQGASAAPVFNYPGTSPEGQAFVLMMEGAYRKLAAL